MGVFSNWFSQRGNWDMPIRDRDRRKKLNRHGNAAIVQIEALEDRTLLSVDFGDAPDTYGTLLASSGARHTVDANLFLGGNTDGETDGNPNAAAKGDDTDQALPDDEDGVVDPLVDLHWTVGAQPKIRVTVTNTTGSAATLSGWIDYDDNGVFDNATERGQINVPDGSNGVTVVLAFPAVPFGSAGNTYARFRLSTDAAAENSTGFASDGEVEDYAVSITSPNLGVAQSFTQIAHETNGGPTLANRDQFGSAIASLGDLNNDGVADLAVGTPGDDDDGDNRGAVHVLLMNADGTLASTVRIDDDTANGPALVERDRFGGSITNLGDLDGDGVTDIAVTSELDGTFQGALHILFLNSDGSVKSSTKIGRGTTNLAPLTDDDSYFGRSIAVLGDLDGDGVTEIAVGVTTGLNDAGAMFVLFLNADASLKSTVVIDADTPNVSTLAQYGWFGQTATGLGDLDGDGVSEIAVGAPQGHIGDQRGRVFILYLNSDGSVKQTATIDNATPNGPAVQPGNFFGRSFANLGDLDGDGVNDLAAGAYDHAQTDPYYGAIHVMLLNADGSIKSTTKIAHNTNGGPSLPLYGSFGTSIANLGDLDGDGVFQIAVGNPDDGVTGALFGAVYVLNLTSVGLDFGDAPTAAQTGFPNSYPVTVAQNGARHIAVGPRLGSQRDVETDGAAQTFAMGDDNSGISDDEAGVTFVANTLAVSASVGTGQVQIDLQNPDPVSNKLDAYIDFNRNGIWESGEKIFDNFDLGTTAGIQVLEFSIPAGASAGTTFARFRLSTIGNLDAQGGTTKGEVEDHAVTFFVLQAPPETQFTGPLTQTGDTTPTLTWAESPHATSYELKVYDVARGVEIVSQTLVGAGATSFTLPTAIDSYSSYSAYVRPVNAVGTGAFTGTSFSHLPGVNQPELTGPFENIFDSTATITWNTFPTTQSYTLMLYSVSRGMELLNQNVGLVEQFETQPLPVGERFQTFVRANLAGGAQVLSTPLYFNVLPSQIAAPQVSLNGPTASTTPQIVFPAVIGAVDYELLVYDKAGGQLVLPATRTGGNAFFSVPSHSPLISGRTYLFYVQGIDAAGVRGFFGALEVTVAAATMTADRENDTPARPVGKHDVAQDRLPIEPTQTQFANAGPDVTPEMELSESELADTTIASNRHTQPRPELLLDTVFTDWPQTDWWNEESSSPVDGNEPAMEWNATAAGLAAALLIQQRRSRAKRSRRR